MWRAAPLALACAFAASLPAQAEAGSLTDREAKLRTSATQSLLAFARTAEQNRMGQRARTAYEAVIEHYAPEDKAAHAALSRKGADWTDRGSVAQLRATELAWDVARKKLAPLHRDLGSAFLDAGDVTRGTWHLERCLACDANDTRAHELLGHESHNGFYGTAEQIAFCRRFEAMTARARELSTQEFATTVLGADEMPAELQKSGLAAFGAKSRGWRVWTTSPSVDFAGAIAQWAERAQEMVEFVLPSGPARRATLVDGRPLNWLLVVRSDAEWRMFFAANPTLLEKAKLVEPPAWRSFRFDSSRGTAEIQRHPPELDADSIIAHVAMWGFATRRNDGLGQGFVHAMTSLLVGSNNTWFGAEPKTRAGSGAALPRDTVAWSARIREEIANGKDWPVVQVPRERLDNFREVVRVKAWSFVTWLMARHPIEWPRVFEAIETDKNPMPEQIEAIFQRELGRSVQDVEAEWREWARGDSAIARATGG